jgi:hypothetical protein
MGEPFSLVFKRFNGYLTKAQSIRVALEFSALKPFLMTRASPGGKTSIFQANIRGF